MSNGPLPSTLTFLSSLPNVSMGSKVRFLGCVTHYALSPGTLTLQHAYPSTSKVNVAALVDVTLLLERLRREDMEVGAWVNVIGYVEEVAKSAGRNTKGGWKEDSRGEGDRKVKVKAILLWGAGGVKLGEYEKALEARLGS